MNKIQIDSYEPYGGFFDLRNFELSKKMFRHLWGIQATLYEMVQKQEYYREWHPAQWEKAKEVSASYQLLLLRHAQIKKS